MSIFVIKIIACITMILDHIKYAIPETNNFFTVYLGRISFPLFAFLITEGYIHTKNLKKYYIRLLIFAVISQIPFMLFRTLVGEYMMLNIMFTLLLGLVAITIYDKVNNKLISIILCLGVVFLGKFINVDYGWFGVATVLIFYIFKKKPILEIIAFSLLTLIFYYSQGLFNFIFMKNFVLYYMCTISSLIFIVAYNGKQGKKIKYFFYWFYPIHMMILYLITYIN